MGNLRLGSLYIVGTIGGYLFASTCNDWLSVGCIPGVFALCSALFSNVIKNWKALAPLGGMRWMVITFAMLIFALALMITIQTLNIGNHFLSSDITANLGAFLVGIFYSMVVIRPARKREAEAPGSHETIVMYIGWGGVAVFFITMFLCFFFAAHPENHYQPKN